MSSIILDRTGLADLAEGAAFLGSGGGGDPYHARLLGEAELSQGHEIKIVPLTSLPDDALVAPCGWVGAPTVSIEKLPSGKEAAAGLRRLESIMGQPIAAVLPVEIGGSNGLAPLIAGAQLGLPIVDADGMGRAFPESQMAVFNIEGLSACPSVVTSADGSLAVVETPDNLAHERLTRSLSVAMGGIAHMVEYPLTGRQAKDFAIRGSISAAIAIGAAVRDARERGRDRFEALFSALRYSGLYSSSGALFDGKIVDLERETRDGFSLGRVVIEGFRGTGTLTLDFQNENLAAWQDGILRAMVPDILTVMDLETAESITTERLSYGQRVRLVGAAAPAILRTERALRFVGPRAFGYTDHYRPLEQLNGWSTP